MIAGLAPTLILVAQNGPIQRKMKLPHRQLKSDWRTGQPGGTDQSRFMSTRPRWVLPSSLSDVIAHDVSAVSSRQSSLVCCAYLNELSYL